MEATTKVKKVQKIELNKKEIKRKMKRIPKLMYERWQ